VDTVLQDLRYGFRMLRKSPAFSAVAIITLGLGIGANTAIFSLVNAVLLRTLPVSHPEQLVAIGDPSRTGGLSVGSPRSDLLSYPLFRELAATPDVFTAVTASGRFGRVMLGLDSAAADAEKVRGRMVTSNYFDVLGVSAMLGRTFEPKPVEVSGSEPEAVISYGLWKRKFARDPNVIGRTVYINGYPLTIIGVAPASFTGEVVGQINEVWVPVGMQEQVMAGRHYLDNVQASWLIGIARLKPGVTVEKAQAAVSLRLQQIIHSSFAGRFDKDNQEPFLKLQIPVSYGGRGLSYFRKQFEKPLLILMAIVGLILLITCFNVANLLLARSSARQKEIAVRVAIGATGWRLTRQLLTESLVLAVAGGLLGLLFSVWGTQLLLRLVAYRGATNAILDASLDGTVLAFTALISIVTGVLFGLAPAIRSRKVEVMAALKDVTRSASGARAPSRFPAGKLLVSAQVALSILVVFVAALLVVSLRNLQQVDVGYDREHLLDTRVDLVAAGIKDQQAVAFCNELLERLKAIPGVRSATFSENGLFSGTESAETIIVEGFTPKHEDDKVTYEDNVGPNYFGTVGIPLLVGRDLGPQDTATAPKTVVVNQTFAKFYFGQENPIGHKIYMDDWKLKTIPIEIVGVARDSRENDLRGEMKRRMYRPTPQIQEIPPEFNFEVRAVGDPAPVMQSVRSAIRQLNPAVPILDAEKVKDLVNDDLAEPNVVAKLSGFFAGLALLLACVGLYGITSYSVAGRTREIGVRMALGAQTGDVLWLVLREALILVAAGVLVGMPIAMAGSRVMRSLLYEVRATDPVLLLVPVAMLAGVGLLAAFIPARRATKVDPLVALRYE
jgi:predicted permease